MMNRGLTPYTPSRAWGANSSIDAIQIQTYNQSNKSAYSDVPYYWRSCIAELGLNMLLIEI